MKNRYIQIFSCLIALLSFATFPACELDDEINFVKGNTISVTTNPISNIGFTYAVAGGVVKATSNNTVIAKRGVVYSTSPTPTIESDNNVSGGSGLGSFGCNLEDLLEETKYYVRAYAINGDGKVLYGEEKSFTTNAFNVTNNGHEYIDLGLSVKWATMNVGASTPGDYGDYFAWGETEPKATYYWGSYKWCNGSDTTLTKYNTDSSYGTVDNKTQLDLSDDAARANWGGAWRMPTYAEWTELREQCTWTWTTQNGAKGYNVKSKNGNFIFLPAAGSRYYSSPYGAGINGYYWSSSLYADDPYRASSVDFGSSDVHGLDSYRYEAQSVRPVLGENESVQTTAPAVTTAVVTQITETSAVVGGNVTSDGGASVTERGVVYSTNPNPVITNLNNTIRPCGSGTGEFTYTITGLQSGTTYYVRAYAKNDVGTAYGEEVTFTPNKLVLETMYLMPPQPSTNDKGKQMTFDGSQFVLYDLGYPNTYECLLAAVGTKFGRIDWNYPVFGMLNGKIALITEEQFTSGEASTILLCNNEIESIDTVRFNPSTLDLYYGGKAIQYVSQLDVNTDLSEVTGKTYRYAKVFFDPAIEVTISGVANIATAHNLDYMEVVNSNVVKFLGEKGMYEVYYLPTEDYIVVEPLKDAVYPNVMWMTGVGFGLPVAEPKTQGGWGFDNLGQYIACRTVAPKVYQFTAYLKNGVNADFATYGSLVFKFFHQKGWGGEESGGNYEQIGLPIQGVGPEGLTKLNGDTGAEAGNWIAATQEKFEGIYRITLDQNKFTTTYEKIR